MSMELTIQKIRQETPTVTSFLFAKPAGMTFQAGQFLHVELPVANCDNRCNRRPFSIAASPTEDYLMITTRHGVSRFKKTFEHLQTSVRIHAAGPLGRFTLDDTDKRPVVFLSGGVGITPIRSMIRYLLDTRASIPVTLLYTSKTPEEIVYQSELEEWAKTHPDFKFVTCVTTPEEGRLPWTGKVGRITMDMVKEEIKDINNVRYYISGPIAMVTDMENMLLSLQIPRECIKTERF